MLNFAVPKLNKGFASKWIWWSDLNIQAKKNKYRGIISFSFFCFSPKFSLCWNLINSGFSVLLSFFLFSLFLSAGRLLCSPSAMFHSASISWRGAFTHVSCPGFYIPGAPVFATIAEGHPLSAWLWRIVGVHPGTVTLGETVLGSLPPQGHCIDSRLKHNSHLSGKEAYLHAQKLWLEGQASSLAYSSRLVEYSGNRGWWMSHWAPPLPCYSLMVSPRKELIP